MYRIHRKPAHQPGVKSQVLTLSIDLNNLHLLYIHTEKLINFRFVSENSLANN